MMKIIKLSIVAIAIWSLAYSAIIPLNGLSKAGETESSGSLVGRSLLLKKWKLSHYEVLGMDYKPEEVEKDDYLHFLENKTYTSISEGKFEKGKYRVKESNIMLTNTTEVGELTFIIKKLTENKLVVVIDDPSDADAKYLIIHFKN